jgi:hypothetical protein
MATAVNNSNSSASVSPPPQSQPKSKSPSVGASFQQAVSQYMQNTTTGAGGPSGSNPSATLSSGLMSSLLQMQT